MPTLVSLLLCWTFDAAVEHELLGPRPFFVFVGSVDITIIVVWVRCIVLCVCVFLDLCRFLLVVFCVCFVVVVGRRFRVLVGFRDCSSVSSSSV